MVPDLHRGESGDGRWDFGKDNVWWGGYMIFLDPGPFFVLLAVLIERWPVYRTFAISMMGWVERGSQQNRDNVLVTKVWKDQRGTYARYIF